MVSKRSRAVHAQPPPGADDFTQISGIGREEARLLYKAGIVTFEHLASLSEEEIAAQLSGPADGQAARAVAERWVAQAHDLARQKAGGLVVEASPGVPGPGDGRALPAEPPSLKAEASMIVISLKLKPDNTVAETLITYPVPGRSPKTVSWQGWDERRLLRVLGGHSRIEAPDEQSRAVGGESVPRHIAAAAGVSAEASAASPQRAADVTPGPRLRRLALLEPSAGAPQRFVSDDSVYRVELEIDLAELRAAGEEPQEYAVRIFGKPLGGGQRLLLGDGRGAIAGESSVSITRGARALPPGSYRLEADLELDGQLAPAHRATTLQGELVCVYS